MHKLIKTLLYFIVSITLFVLIVILFISPITKYLIQKYDVEYTGRQITLDRSYVNPFTGYIYFSDLKIYELKNDSTGQTGDSIFFSTDGFSAKVEILKLFSKIYEISELTLSHPFGIIIQNKKEFNFSDLIDKLSSKKNSDINKEPLHFNILKVIINNGELYYREQQIPINHSIKKLFINSTGIQWNSDTIAAHFSFLSGMGRGEMKGNFTINIKNLDYRLVIAAHKFDLKILEQYLKDLTNGASFSAYLDADLKAKGNFNDGQNITITGMLAINDFHFGKVKYDDYASFDTLKFVIIELSPGYHKYLFDSVTLSHPYLKYERYDYLDNMQIMFGKDGSNISQTNADSSKFNLVVEIAKYIKVLSKNFFQSNYKINKLEINKGDLKFNDYSVNEKFSLDFKPLYVNADSIDKNRRRVKASFRSGIFPYGYITVTLSINPRDSGDYDMQYYLQKLPLAMFNPYTITYTSYPLDRGTIELKGEWNVRSSAIKSVNHLVIIDPRVSKRLKNKKGNWIPIPLIMTFVRERGNVIDYEIPITGNLKNPKFHLRDVLNDLLKNIFVKPVTLPYRMQVRNTETLIEKSLTIKWKMRNTSLLPGEEKFIKLIADYLADNPKERIVVYPQHYTIKEKEYILFFEAKKKYYLITHKMEKSSFADSDSLKVEKMSVKDSLFIVYLNQFNHNSSANTIQEKCTKFLDKTIINSRFNQIINEREETFLSFFKEKKVEKQIKIYGDKNVIPYNGFSFYKIDYKGNFPESLIKAYEQMNELNDEIPRKKFKKERKKYENKF